MSAESINTIPQNIFYYIESILYEKYDEILDYIHNDENLNHQYMSYWLQLQNTFDFLLTIQELLGKKDYSELPRLLNEASNIFIDHNNDTESFIYRFLQNKKTYFETSQENNDRIELIESLKRSDEIIRQFLSLKIKINSYKISENEITKTLQSYPFDNVKKMLTSVNYNHLFNENVTKDNQIQYIKSFITQNLNLSDLHDIANETLPNKVFTNFYDYIEFAMDHYNPKKGWLIEEPTMHDKVQVFYKCLSLLYIAIKELQDFQRDHPRECEVKQLSPSNIIWEYICPVCQEDYVANDQVTVYSCKHFLHTMCYNLNKDKDKCPICRQENDVNYMFCATITEENQNFMKKLNIDQKEFEDKIKKNELQRLKENELQELINQLINQKVSNPSDKKDIIDNYLYELDSRRKLNEDYINLFDDEKIQKQLSSYGNRDQYELLGEILRSLLNDSSGGKRQTKRKKNKNRKITRRYRKKLILTKKEFR